MRVSSLSDPAVSYKAVTPNDGADLGQKAHGLYIGGAGDVVVSEFAGGAGATVTFKAVPAGTILPIQVWQVKATLTTATNIVALFKVG